MRGELGLPSVKVVWRVNRFSPYQSPKIPKKIIYCQFAWMGHSITTEKCTKPKVVHILFVSKIYIFFKYLYIVIDSSLRKNVTSFQRAKDL